MTDRNVERALMISKIANRRGRRYLYRGVEQWQLVRLITWRSVVRSHPPQHNGRLFDNDVRQSFFYTILTYTHLFVPPAPIRPLLYHPLLYSHANPTSPSLWAKNPTEKIPWQTWVILGWLLGDSWVIAMSLPNPYRILADSSPKIHRYNHRWFIGDS